MTVTFVMYSFFLVETEEFSGNKAFLNPEGYEYFGLFSAMLIILFGFTSALSTHRFIPYLHKAQDEAYFSLRVFLKELYECFSNKSWLVMLLAGGFYGLNIGITSGTATYVNTYFSPNYRQFCFDLLNCFGLLCVMFTISEISSRLHELTQEHACTHSYIHSCIHAYMHTCIRAYVHAYMHTYIHG